MIKYYSTSNKVSDAVRYYSDKGYKISADINLYKINSITNMDEKINELGIIVLVNRKSSIEILIKDDSIPTPETFSKIEEEIDDSSIDKVIFNKVHETMQQSGIHNPLLMDSLSRHCDDIVEDEINIEEIVILSKDKHEKN